MRSSHGSPKANGDTSPSSNSASPSSDMDVLPSPARDEPAARAATPMKAVSSIATTSDSPSFARSASADSFSFARSASADSFVRRSANFGAELNRDSRTLTSAQTVNGLLAFSSGLMGRDFKKEVANNRRRIRSISGRTLSPHSRLVRIWDLLVVLALVFTAFVTPFEVALFSHNADGYEGPLNFTLNRIADSIFVLDIILNFFLPYKESLRRGGIIVYDQSKICRHYLASWFAFDLCTCVPFDVLVGAVASVQGWADEAASSEVIPLLRIFRMVKLLRIFRAARILRRWQDHVVVSFALLSLIKFILLTVLLAHWLACLWCFVASSSDEEWTGYDSGLSWRQKASLQLASAYELCDPKQGLQTPDRVQCSLALRLLLFCML